VHDAADALAPGMTSGLQINAELGFRYTFSYYILAEVGYGALYNWASGPASFKDHNVMMEVPILVGGYYTFLRRLYTYGAIGPSVSFFSRTIFDPGVTFVADPKVGMHVLAGADFMVSEHFSVGLELRYRYLKSGELKFKDPTRTKTGDYAAGTAVTQDMLLGDKSSATYDLDFSGVSLGLKLRFYVL